MRTILSFDYPAMEDARTAPVERARPAVGLFRMGEAAPGEAPSKRWGQAVVVAVAVHVAALAAGVMFASARPEKAPTKPEPELVFLTFAPPPPAPASAGAAKVEKAPRPTKARTPRPVERQFVAPVPKPIPEPVEPEPPVDVAPSEPTEEAPAANVGEVVGGVVGGVIGGQQGGVVGASGGTGEALGLKQVSRPPAVLKQVAPDYPRRARSDGIQGLVVVRIIIGTDGKVEPENTRVIRSVPALDQAAIDAVSRWRFSPALGREGRPVRVIIEIPVEFSLK
ncbi:energy transducer TonB [Pyxidicoccus sp. MSG2]|uniref:energy transducer TonB n=1 Tax=Pyxidicoccus sp. MSG2 TaxID=2996790 RepID=UPI00227155EF|nr:energy transducer TonB [Pyxidicoccus sp. MSG2]MCY1023519.1 TonB family protein [Pyxidicoccus sp. MSG2]